jgi:thiamine transporter ThiT
MGKSIVIQPLIGLAINLALSIILDFIPTIDLMRLWILWAGIIIRIVSLVHISIDI